MTFFYVIFNSEALIVLPFIFNEITFQNLKEISSRYDLEDTSFAIVSFSLILPAKRGDLTSRFSW